MHLAAVGAAAAGVAGFVAQGAVHPDEEAHRVLSFHRNLNLGTAVATAALAAARSRSERPGAGYLLAGLGTVAAMVYGGYLGGRLVYEHRLGVKPEEGWDEERTPEIRLGTAGNAARTSARHVRDEVAHTVRHWTDG